MTFRWHMSAARRQIGHPTPQHGVLRFADAEPPRPIERDDAAFLGAGQSQPGLLMIPPDDSAAMAACVADDGEVELVRKDGRAVQRDLRAMAAEIADGAVQRRGAVVESNQPPR